MNSDIVSEAKQGMQRVFSVLGEDLGTIRTGRATPALIENISVVVYSGTQRLKIREIGTVFASDPRTLVLTPFDHSILDDIQKGIMSANVGLTPSNDGNVIRISVPPLSQERRLDLTKLVKQKLENGRIMIRQVRHEAMADVKKKFTGKEISEEEMRRLEKEIQKITDEIMAQIESLRERKEQELMQI